MSVQVIHATEPTAPDILARRSAQDERFSLTETMFSDVDDQSTGLKRWHQDYEQLSAGVFKGIVEEVWLGAVQLFRERATQVVHQTGAPWHGSRTIGVPIETSEHGVLNGTLMDMDTVFTFGSDEFDFRTPKRFDSVAVTVTADAIEEFAIDVWHLDIKNSLAHGGAFRCSPELPPRLREFLMLMLSSVKDYPKMLDYPHVRRGMQQEILNSIVLAIGDTSFTAATPVTWSRVAIVEQARKYVFAHRQEPIMVSDLCKALKVCRRTLQYSFQTALNINPVAYLRAVRLNGVRRALRAARGDRAACVADIAASWGFWHLSHFAGDYKQMFGELPSHTLRARR